MKTLKLYKLLALGIVLVFLYSFPYFVLSRAGHAQARQWGMKGFYFVLPTSEEAYRSHLVFADFYYPLLCFEGVAGTGMPLGPHMIMPLKGDDGDTLP